LTQVKLYMTSGTLTVNLILGIADWHYAVQSESNTL